MTMIMATSNRVWGRTSRKFLTIRNNLLSVIKNQNATAPAKNSKENLCLVLHGVNDLRLECRPIREPKENEVLLRVCWAGICGSDIHSYTVNQNGKMAVKTPIVLGHESSGVVEKVGSAVKHLQCGDKVAIEAGIPCGMCDYCKIGRNNLCENLVYCSVPPHDGTICQYHVHPANYCFKLPEKMCLEAAALMEPLSVALYSCQRGNIGFGDKVLINGCGPLGLLTLIVAKHMGALHIVVTDKKDYRLDLAKAMGADCTINVGTCEGDQLGNIVSEIKKHFCNSYPDKTIDCVGSETTVTTAAMVTRPGGTIVLSGYKQNEMKLPIKEFVLIREVDVKGVFRCCNTSSLQPVSNGNQSDIERMRQRNQLTLPTNSALWTLYVIKSQEFDLLAQGILQGKNWFPFEKSYRFQTAMAISQCFSVDPKRLITHKFKLQDAIEAFETAKNGCGNPVKIMIHCNCPC